jgi:3-dehydroquinate synthase
METKILNFNYDIDKLLDLELLNQYHELIFITDENVNSLYNLQIKVIKEKCQSKDKKCLFYVLPNGENSKCIENKIKIENYMLSNNISRSKSCILALGGGVVGDLTGFIASTYKRGIDFIQIPTTVISMVDSSIGGKNGINNKFGKNLIGTFYQPKYILLFFNFLQTLPQKELINGMAEVIKISALSPNLDLWDLLNQNNLIAIKKNKEIIHDIILKAINLKVEICKNDLHDNSISNNIKLELPREHLNFGHTIGHIIEYSSKLPHGYAVSLGMIYELKLQSNQEITQKLEHCLTKYGLPTALNNNINKEDIIHYFNNDKKDGRIVLLNKIGNSYSQKFDISKIINIINI